MPKVSGSFSAVFLLSLFFLAAACGPAAALLSVGSFQADAVIYPNGTVEVTETIGVTVSDSEEGEKFFQRVVPYVYRDSRGQTRKNSFNFVYAAIDGDEAMLNQYREGENHILTVGSQGAPLLPGDHTITLNYTSSGWVLIKEQADELYWNVTGFDWQTPIEEAAFSVRLLQNAPFLTATGFTGFPGDHGSDLEINQDGRFKTTRPLMPGEGLTVVVSWPKGFTIPPPPTTHEIVAERVRNNSFFICLLYIFALLAYQLSMRSWRYSGAPKAGALTGAVPSDVTPGLARYIHSGAYSVRCLIADLLLLAIGGYIVFTEKSNVLTLCRGGNRDGDLPHYLRTLLNDLGDGGLDSGIKVGEVGGKLFYDIGTGQKKRYGELAGHYFCGNSLGNFGSLFYLIPMFMVIVYYKGEAGDTLYRSAVYALAALLVARSFTNNLSVHLITLSVFAISGYLLSFDLALYGVFWVGLALTSYFSYNLPRLTNNGVKATGEIEAFIRCVRDLTATEKLTTDLDTVSRYERMLPYAYALNADTECNNWFFRTEVSRRYTPCWLARDAWDRYDRNDFDYLVHKMATEIKGAAESYIQSSAED